MNRSSIKKVVSVILSLVMVSSTAVTSFANEVNADNIVNQKLEYKGRYWSLHNGQEFGWQIECYVATSEDGKLNHSKSLRDPSNAKYVGRCAAIEGNGSIVMPSIKRTESVEIGLGYSSLPPTTTSIRTVCGARSLGFPDPFTQGGEVLRQDLRVNSPAMQNVWDMLEADGVLGRVASAVHPKVLEKAMSMKDALEMLRPNREDNEQYPCPVEYAFVIVPLAYIHIRQDTRSAINLNQEQWIGAWDGAIMNNLSCQTSDPNLVDRVREIKIPNILFGIFL